MDDNNNITNGRVGECPKRVFWLLPRPAIKPACKGEDPKAFIRRMSLRAQMANPNPVEAADHISQKQKAEIGMKAGTRNEPDQLPRTQGLKDAGTTDHGARDHGARTTDLG
jgi:hypothetical protein